MKTLLAGMLLTVSGSAMAQATYTDANETRYEFQKHAFLNLEAGAQYTRGEAKFSKLISPNFQLGLGYQFTPVIAARLQGNLYQSKGGWNGYQVGTETPYTRTYNFFYAAPGIDVMFNLSNLFAGYNPTRIFNLSAFVGGGANIAWHNGEVNRIAMDIENHGLSKQQFLLEYLWDGTKIRPFGRFGLEAAFRLSDDVALTIEGNANLLSDKYNSKKAGNPDWYFNALAGLKINLGKAHKKYVKEVIPVDPYAGRPVHDTVYITKTLKDTVYVEKPEALRRDIFFTINKWDIRPSEQQKVADIANYLQRYPNAKVNLCGYADVQTGNDRINDELGRNRVNAVKQELISKYGISEYRIQTDSKGARVQPFAVNEQNRVTIAICE